MPAQEKKYMRAHLYPVAHACHPGYQGSINKRVTVQVDPGIK
jgi:hypothetical protein